MEHGDRIRLGVALLAIVLAGSPAAAAGAEPETTREGTCGIGIEASLMGFPRKVVDERLGDQTA